MPPLRVFLLLGLCLPLVAVVACGSQPLPSTAKVAEEPLHLTPLKPLPSDSDAGPIPDDAPTRLPNGASTDDGGVEAAGVIAVVPPVDGGPARECPARKDMPTDIGMTPADKKPHLDGGVTGSIRIALNNRRNIPRMVGVSEVDRVMVLQGSSLATPVRVTRIALEEGGGGLAESKVMLHAAAAATLIVDFEPAGPPPYRVHLEVDAVPACLEWPGGGAATGPRKTRRETR